MRVEDPASATQVLESLSIEIPSWGFANTGTRFGKFLQAGAATTIDEKFADAAQVNALTGVTPQLALHVQWDLPAGVDDVRKDQEAGHDVWRATGINQSQLVSGSGI